MPKEPPPSLAVEPCPSPWRLIRIVLIALFAEIGFDFLVHAGILADLYKQPSPFLLPLDQAARLIPLGYLSFLIITALLAWLMVALEVRGGRRGLLFGLAFGGTVWASLVIGLASISTAGWSLLGGWFIGQSLELGIAGMVIGAGLKAERLTRVALSVAGFVIACLVVGIVLQNL